MKKIVVAIPHSHSFFWTQTCIASLLRNPPRADGFEVAIVVIDNSPWSPAIKGITNTNLVTIGPWSDTPSFLKEGIGFKSFSVFKNYKSNRFHASALDCVVEGKDLPYDFKDFDLLMAWETDVLALRPTWLQWFVDQMRLTDYAVGHWHHEQFVNPSCTLYRGDVIRSMAEWCKTGAPQDELRWGERFEKTAPLDSNLHNAENPASVLLDMKGWICGPFAEKRGWPEGTVLKEPPSGQLKGFGWFEPGQQLHHWAVEAGYTYTVCPTMTTKRADGLPLQTLYGSTMPDPQRQLEAVELFGNAETAHMWGGTRALDILKHPVTCNFVKSNTPGWLAREARFWRETVPPDVQAQTLELIRKYGWHITGQGSDHVSERDKEAAAFVRECYAQGGVEW